MEAQLAGVKVDVNHEGYLTDFSQWNREVGEKIAAEEGITMTPRHWEIVEWLQQQVQAGKELSIRKIKNSGVLDIKEFYALFPGGPLKVSTKIAGVPKPKSCI
ncbi:MAG: TusE/DsrC/DsvC family sulfur relay protein [Salinimicrobium sp.]